MGRAGECFSASLLKISDGLGPVLAQERMMGQPVYVLGQPVRIHSLDGFNNSHVKRASALLEQAAVCHFMGERVLKGILDIWKILYLVYELCCLESLNGGAQLIFGDLS